MKTELSKAIETLQKALKEDESYFYSWQANIAMAFKDEYSRADEKDIHKIANNAAKYFLHALTQPKEE